MNNLGKPGLSNLFGMNVYTNAHLDYKRPKIQISPGFEWITEEGRSRINKRLHDLFGEEEIAYILNEKYKKAMEQQITESLMLGKAMTKQSGSPPESECIS